MATFTIDLLTGNLYLFTFNASGSGSTSGSTYPAVGTYADLPPAGSSTGLIYLVRTGTGAYVANRKDGSLYYSNGIVWTPLPNVPAFFNSANFQVFDGSDNTKGVSFVTSGLTSGIFRKLVIPNKDGTIALLSDLPEGNIAQLVDNSGGTEINNIPATPIVWTTLEFTGTSVSFTGGSRIYVTETGAYSIGYVLDYGAVSGGTQNIGSTIRVNNSVDIVPLTTSSFAVDVFTNDGTNLVPAYKLNLLAGDYIELLAFRTGNPGSVLTHAGASWITVLKENS